MDEFYDFTFKLAFRVYLFMDSYSDISDRRSREVKENLKRKKKVLHLYVSPSM